MFYKTIFLCIAVLIADGGSAQAGDSPTNAPKAELSGTNLPMYVDTGRVALRQVSCEINGSQETNNLFIPVLARKGVLYLDQDGVEKMLLLRQKMANYRAKVDELEKLGEEIKTDYVSVITNARPNTAP